MDENNGLTTGDLYYIFRYIDSAGTPEEKFESIRRVLDLKFEKDLSMYHITKEDLWGVTRFLLHEVDKKNAEIDCLKELLNTNNNI